MRISKLIIALTAISSIYIAADVANAVGVRHDVPVSEFEELGARYPQAGFVGREDREGFRPTGCGGTLVAPDLVLSAAHCFDQDADGVSPTFATKSFFGNLPTIDFASDNLSDLELNVESIVINPQWIETEGDPRYDLAIMKLKTPITDIEPLKVSATNPTGRVGTFAGFGQQFFGNGDPLIPGLPDGVEFGDGSDLGFGDGGEIGDGGDLPTVDADDPNGPEIIGIPQLTRLGGQNIIEDEELTMDFDSPDGTANFIGSEIPIALEATTAGGDSGSGLLVDFEGDTFVVGVAHGGFNAFGGFGYGDVPIWSPVALPENVAFLQNNGVEVQGVPEPSGIMLSFIAGISFLSARRRRTSP